jgi:hypothetical protein
LQSIGVDVETAVELIVITHWHDDHIKGAVDTIDACKRAKLCISQALTEKEFVKFAGAISANKLDKHGSGVDEIIGVAERLTEPGRGPHRGSQDKRILTIPATDLSHAQHCELWTLSPSDFQTTMSETRFAKRLPELGKTMRRAVPSEPNNHSVALWLVVGEVNVILGADLETTADPRAGWDSVVASVNRPQGKAGFFKVPHHGSITGHHDGVWSDVLLENAVAVATPWNRGRDGLPLEKDVERLVGLTENFFLTAVPSGLVRSKHDHEVEKMMRKFGIRTLRHPSSVAAVTARKDPSSGNGWQVSDWQLSDSE